MRKLPGIMTAIALVVIAANLTVQTVRSMVKPRQEVIEKTSIVEVIGKVSGDYGPHGASTRGLIAKDPDGGLSLIPFTGDEKTWKLEREEMPKLVRITRIGDYTGYSPLFYEK